MEKPVGMKYLKFIGVSLCVFSLLVFMTLLSMNRYQLSTASFEQAVRPEHRELLSPVLRDMQGKVYESTFDFVRDFKGGVRKVNLDLREREEWDKIIWDDYSYSIVRHSNTGQVAEKAWTYFSLCFILAVFGGLIYIISSFKGSLPGIKNNGIFFTSSVNRGWMGIVLGSLLIAFYVLLYQFPEYITNWVIMLDPLSMAINGHMADQWFLYGFMYTLAMTVMGVRMMLKYRHSMYHLVRTASVIFFQICFAFTLPQILKLLNKPSYDLKSIWPLEYTFFFDWRMDEHLAAGTFGIWMFVWGILLFAIAVPVLTYFYGKRWYCSWVCGCGGLAETAGDPFRHLSDKRLISWKIERYMVHSVLVFAVLMTIGVLYTYLTGEGRILGISTEGLRHVYGFVIGFAFAGVVGTGFYPLMGNRMWCRFGCPLAAYLGIIQRFKSRFRITTNGGQCISCGNCSTYCEMGIDVRWYAQRGQNVVRASCVGCGVCASVCPRGVLKLENGPGKFRISDDAILIGSSSARLND